MDRAQERAAKRGTQSSPGSSPEEVRYSVDDLRENPRLINANSRAVDGAFSDLSASGRKTFTLDEAAKRVRTFLGRAEADA